MARVPRKSRSLSPKQRLWPWGMCWSLANGFYADKLRPSTVEWRSWLSCGWVVVELRLSCGWVAVCNKGFLFVCLFFYLVCTVSFVIQTASLSRDSFALDAESCIYSGVAYTYAYADTVRGVHAQKCESKALKIHVTWSFGIALWALQRRKPCVNSRP